MRYAIGRRVHPEDMPTIRRIASDASDEGYRMSSFILGVILSDPFRLSRAEGVTAQPEPSE
jgi:hypothetical protein